MIHTNVFVRYLSGANFDIEPNVIIRPKGRAKTHYNTFIHTGCKVPWALRGLSRGGVRSLRRPLLTKAKMSATFLMVSPSA